MTSPPTAQPAPSSSPGAAPVASPPTPSAAAALDRALARLADALDRSGPEGEVAHAQAFAAVMNLVGDAFLDARVDFIGRLVDRLASDARHRRLLEAWVHFMDHFAGYVLQGAPGDATRHVYALAGVLEGVPVHHRVGRVESTAAIERALSRAAFGRDGCVRVSCDLEPPGQIEPDFFGFLQFYAIRQAPDAPASIAPALADADANFSASDQDDVRWAGLSPGQRADEAVEREAILAVCVQPPDDVETDHGELMAQLRDWASGCHASFELTYAIDGVRHDARLSIVAAGAPFSTALAMRQYLVDRDVHALVERARASAAAAAGARVALRAVVSLLAPPEELDEHVDDPLVRPGVALFDAHDGRLLAGLRLAASAGELDEQLAAVRDALAACGLDAMRCCPTPRPDTDRDGRPVHYDEHGEPHVEAAASGTEPPAPGHDVEPA